jgi:hypothetical protein
MGYVRTKPDALAPFQPSDLFKSAAGFYVRAKVESVERTESPDLKPLRTVVVHAWEPDGYEVVFTAPVKAAIEAIGQEVDIPGHAIIRYSGALGAWGPARIRQTEPDPRFHDAPELADGSAPARPHRRKS